MNCLLDFEFGHCRGLFWGASRLIRVVIGSDPHDDRNFISNGTNFQLVTHLICDLPTFGVFNKNESHRIFFFQVSMPANLTRGLFKAWIKVERFYRNIFFASQRRYSR